MELVLLMVLTFMAMFLAFGLILWALLIKFYTSTIPTLNEVEWGDVDWENEVDETESLRPLLGVVHPGNRNLL